MSYPLFMKICATVAIGSLCLGMVLPTIKCQRVWKTLYAIAAIATGAALIATVWTQY